MDINVHDLDDDELETLRRTIQAERNRRDVLESAPESVNQLAAAYLNARAETTGPEWVQPTGGHDAYPTDWEVTFDGRTWKSLIDANVWEPGVSGWREVDSNGDEPAIWVQPTGAHDAYGTGDHVMFESEVWVSTIDGNVWEPGVHGWERVSG